MYEEITYEGLLQQMLDTALEHNPNIDTREGSVVWLGQAPAAVEMQNLYVEMDQILNETFADTASREMLIKRAKERGLSPYPATKMVGKGQFTPPTLEIPIGSRFNLNTLNYVVTEKIEDGAYRLECETAGEIGNESTGTLIPIEYIDGLETAKLVEILIPGEDEEDTEAFRQRYFNSLDAQAFGGNVSDYIEKVNALPGVGGVKVYREWNGDIQPASLIPPESFQIWFAGLGSETPAEVKSWLSSVSDAASNGLLTVGGTVRLVIIDATYSAPSEELVEQVQTAVDPEENHGDGLGLAPIGHVVTVEGVSATQVNIQTTITYQEGWDWEASKAYIEAAVDAYLNELSQTWAGSESGLVVRISGIETNILSCPGVLDIANTSLNGSAQNLTLDADSIPVRGTING